MARRAGAARAVLIEPSALRRKTAARLGTGAALAPGDLSAALSSNTFQPVDRVFECSGHPAALQTAIDTVAPGGSIRMIGASPQALAFSSMSALLKEITITTNFIYEEYAGQTPNNTGFLGHLVSRRTATGALEHVPGRSGARRLPLD